ncbi:MAG: SDR family oxidoreductase [Candidatus Binatia bacterium]
MKAFVTGSTGLLGNNLVRELVGKGHTVSGLVRSEEKGRRLLGDLPVQLVRGDMREVASFGAALDGCDVVFHTAAYFREYYQPGDHAAALDEINVRATLRLMDEADRRGVRRLVHTSSGGTIGVKPDGSPGDEETPPAPIATSNLYFKSKVDGDAAIRAWRPQRGLAVIEILPGWIWGPGDAAPTAAGQLALDFLQRKIPAQLDGGTCLVDARDVAAGMVAAAERGRAGERYILGGTFHTLAEVLAGLERASGVPAPRRRIPHAAAMVFAWLSETVGRLTGQPVLITREGLRTMHAKLRMTSAKAERELGARFRPLDDTLRDVVAWYRAAPDRAA